MQPAWRKLWILSLFLSSTTLAWEKTIYISRHGETVANQEHVNIGQKADPRVVLDEKGKEQAAKLADFLGSSGIQRIYVSRLIRTQQTVEPLAKKLGLAPYVRSNLDEMNMGHLEGQPTDSPETRENFQKLDQDCSYRFAGDGESRKDLDQRLQGMIDEIEKSATPKNILLIGHFGTVRGLLVLFLEISCEEGGKIAPANTDLFRLTVQNGKVKKIERSQDRQPFNEVKLADLMKNDQPVAMRPSDGPLPKPSASSAKEPAPKAH